MSATLLGVLQAALNRALALDPELPEVLAPIDGARLALAIAAPEPIVVCVTFARDGVALHAAANVAQCEADVSVSGTPAALFALLTRGDALPAGTGVSVHGDVGLLQAIRGAARRLRPDWEEPIARVLGDELGHPLARGLRHAAAGVARTLRELHADLGEFLREESGWLAAQGEVDAFGAAVDDLRDAAERLDKRIAQAERARAPRR